jgi:hypothetical protein
MEAGPGPILLAWAFVSFMAKFKYGSSLIKNAENKLILTFYSYKLDHKYINSNESSSKNINFELYKFLFIFKD